MNEYVVLIDLAIVAGASFVVPAALGRWTGAWRAVAATTAISLLLAPHPLAGLLAVPWMALALAGAIDVLRALRRHPVRSWTVELLGPLAVTGWSVAAGAFLIDTGVGDRWLGYGEPIVRLTVVHFTYAGVGTSAMAAAALGAGGDRSRRWRAPALVVVAVAPALVAMGFATGSSVFEVGGPVVMAIGAYSVGTANLADGWSQRSENAGRLLVVSGASVLVPMVLAVAFSLAPHTGGPALSIPEMVRFHGGAQALGFVGCGLAGRWLARCEPSPSGRPRGGAQREPAGVAPIGAAP